MCYLYFQDENIYVYKLYYSVVDRSCFRLRIMAFRIHLLFVCISLYILLQYDANARTLDWPEVINV